MDPLEHAPDGRRPSSAERDPARPAEQAPLSILIVEDNQDAGATLGDLLSLFGHAVRVVASGIAGVEAIEERTPDVLICDLGLPDVTGVEVIRRARSRAPRGAMFAIALTGYTQPRDRDEALHAGFDAHLAKPPDLDELRSVLAAVRPPRAGIPGLTPAPAATPAAPRGATAPP